VGVGSRACQEERENVFPSVVAIQKLVGDAVKQAVCQQRLLKALQKGPEQAVPGSDGALASLSLSARVNLVFLLKGEWRCMRRTYT